MVGVWAPLAYLVFLCGTLWTLNRVIKRKFVKETGVRAQSVLSWFPKRKARSLYFSMLSMEPPPPPPAIAGALLNRALEAVQNLKMMNEHKNALVSLLQKDLIGDDAWEDFLAAEKQMEAEVQEIVEESNTFVSGFGQTLFNVAAEMDEHCRIVKIYKDIAAKREMPENAPKSLLYGPESSLSMDTVTLLENRDALESGDAKKSDDKSDDADWVKVDERDASKSEILAPAAEGPSPSTNEAAEAEERVAQTTEPAEKKDTQAATETTETVKPESTEAEVAAVPESKPAKPVEPAVSADATPSMAASASTETTRALGTQEDNDDEDDEDDEDAPGGDQGDGVTKNTPASGKAKKNRKKKKKKAAKK